jgi:hypothetical protein
MSQIPEGGDLDRQSRLLIGFDCFFTFDFSKVVAPRATVGSPYGEIVVILFRSGGRVNHFVFHRRAIGRRRPNQAKRGPTLAARPEGFATCRRTPEDHAENSACRLASAPLAQRLLAMMNRRFPTMPETSVMDDGRLVVQTVRRQRVSESRLVYGISR